MYVLKAEFLKAFMNTDLKRLTKAFYVCIDFLRTN